MKLDTQINQKLNRFHTNNIPKMASDQPAPRPAKKKWQLNPIVQVTLNDGSRSSLKTLIDIKNVISQQLPKMPKNYITKILFDERHQSLYLQQQGKVIGTACFRCFNGKNFVELVFLAVIQTFRDNGLGSKIIDNLKQLLQTRGKNLLLTYADCTAVGFFKKQAFQSTVEYSQKQWANYIKPYEGGCLMQCRIDLNFKYAKFRQTLKFQQECLLKKIKEVSVTDIKYHIKAIQSIIKKRNAQLKFKNKENKDQKTSNLPVLQEDIDLELVPGLLDNLWSKKYQYELQNKKQASVFLQQLYSLQCIRKLPSFEVFHIIQVPPAIAQQMTLVTVQKKINSNYYQTTHDFVKELKEMIKQWKRWCPGEAEDMFYQFSKKTNIILDKLLCRKLQLKIEPMYRQGKTKFNKATHKK